MSAVEMLPDGREDVVGVEGCDVCGRLREGRGTGVPREDSASDLEVSIETRWAGVSEVEESCRLMGAKLGTLAEAGIPGAWKEKVELGGY